MSKLSKNRQYTPGIRVQCCMWGGEGAEPVCSFICMCFVFEKNSTNATLSQDGSHSSEFCLIFVCVNVGAFPNGTSSNKFS